MKKSNINIDSIATPIVLLDMDTLDSNINEMTQLANEAGVKLRPHTKVHDSPYIAELQVNAGSSGIEVGSVERAICMMDSGINDILIAHPFYDEIKIEMLEKYFIQPNTNITLMVDMIEQVEQFNRLGKRINKKIPLLLKVSLNDKHARFGVPPGKPALEFSKKITQFSNIQFKGIYGHETGVESTKEGVSKAAFEGASIMSETARLLKKEGINVKHVSVGASSTFRETCRYLKENKFTEITEIHPGNCVIGDIWHVKNLGNKREACAVSILVTVMDNSHSDFFVVDAGYKTFGNDSLINYREQPGFFWQGEPSFGSVQGRPDLWLGRLSAETACIYYKDSDINKTKRFKIGERLEIVPNNSTIVFSLQKNVYGVRQGTLERIIPIGGNT